MTIVTRQVLETEITMPGMTGSLGSETKEREVTYTATRLLDFDGKRGLVEYTVAVDGMELSEPFRFDFSYSGKGSPLEEAEKSLEKYLENQAKLPPDPQDDEPESDGS